MTDELLTQVKAFIYASKTTSIATIQRKLHLKYKEVVCLLEQLEKEGLLGALPQQGQRAVNWEHKDWLVVANDLELWRVWVEPVVNAVYKIEKQQGQWCVIKKSNTKKQLLAFVDDVKHGILWLSENDFYNNEDSVMNSVVSNQFEQWALNYSGCDGGDIGSKHNPSTWVCGIEWGGGHTKEELIGEMTSDVSVPPQGYETWEHNVAYPFNWQVMKLLSAINGGQVDDYRSFAEQVKPFTKGAQGYFKTNLYPIAFKDTNPDKWLEDFSVLTGLDSKNNYALWCKEKRFAQMNQWVKNHHPKLIICLGKTYINDFAVAFVGANANFNTELIDEREINWTYNEVGTLVVVLPFMLNPNGLIKNESIQTVGERIAQISNT